MTTRLDRKLIDKAEADDLIAISNELLNKAQWPRLTLNEQRLVLYMLALVRKNDKDFKRYRISIKELQNIIGSQSKNVYARFDVATDALMGRIIKWIDPEYQDLVKTTWCSYARLSPGRGFVEVEFHPALKPFLIAMKGNFTRYELRSVIRLQSHYSLRIYQFLKFNQGLASKDSRLSATITVDWLKEYLDIGADQYRLYGHFKSKILKRAQRDIAQKTDLLFDFLEHKESRRVKYLEFFWHKNPDYDQQELPFNPPVEHQNTMRKKSARRVQSLPTGDKILSRLQELGFSDGHRIRRNLTDDDWRLALADLEYNINHKAQKQNVLQNPGGWLRSRLPEEGTPYKSSQPYQQHLNEISARKEKAARKKEQDSKEKQSDIKERQQFQRIEKQITQKIKALSKSQHTRLWNQAKRNAQEIMPKSSPHLDSTTQRIMRDLVRQKYKITGK